MSNKIIMHHANILQQRAATDFEKNVSIMQVKALHARKCLCNDLTRSVSEITLGKSSNCCQTIILLLSSLALGSTAFSILQHLSLQGMCQMDSALEPEQEDLKYLKHLKQEPTVGQAFRSPILPL